MATVREPRGRKKVDDFLDARLNEAEARVRWTDVADGVLTLCAGVLAFALVMVVLDRWLVLPDAVRQLALAGLISGAGYYVWRGVVPPLASVVNPYYAARQLERTLPEAKNSLVNWLDLRGESIAPPVRDALAKRAAADLKQADFERALQNRRLGVAAMTAGLLLVAMFVAAVALRPATFVSLLGRTFMPFAGSEIAAQTHIQLLEPVGDVDVPIHHSVNFRVDVRGRVPKPGDADEVRLKLRYHPTDADWEVRPLESTDRAGEWTVRVPSAQVRTGFEFQVVGGDAETAVHRVRVRTKPLITDFAITYHYRAYLRRPDDGPRSDPNIEDIRGTVVTLLARTNRTAKEGTLTFAPAEPTAPRMIVTGTPAAGQPDTLKFQFTLKESGVYRLKFTSDDGESSDETLPFAVTVLPDRTPSVEITRKAPKQLASNAGLAIDAFAKDDYGLTKATLHLGLRPSADEPAVALAPLPAGEGQALNRPDGTWPTSLDIKERRRLDRLQDAHGKPVTLRPGMVLEYQFEVEDNYDDPAPQAGRSTLESVTIVEPQSPQPGNQGNQQPQEKSRVEEPNPPQPGDGKQPPGQPDQSPGDKGDNQKQPDAGQGGTAQKQPGGGADGQPGQRPEGGEKPLDPEDQNTMDKARELAKALEKQSQQGGDNKSADNPKQPGEQTPTENNQPQPGGKDGQSQGDKPGQPQAGDKAKPESGDGKHGEKPDQPRQGDKSARPDQGQPKSNDSKPEQGDNKLPADKSGKGEQHKNSPGDQSKAGQKPDDAGKTGDKPPRSGDNKNPAENAAPRQGDKNAGDKTKPEKPTTAQNTQGKTGQKGEKPGDGMTGKPNDQTPQTSPDKGNGQGGQQNSGKTGDEQKTTPDRNAQEDARAGKADAKTAADKAGKAEAKGGNSRGEPEKGDAQGKGTPGKAEPSKEPGKTQDAPAGGNKEPGKQANKPESPGTKGEKPGDQKPAPGDKASGEPPADAEKVAESIRQAKKLVEKLKDMSPAQRQELADKIDQLQGADSKSRQEMAQRASELAKKFDTPENRQAIKELAEQLKDLAKGNEGKPNPDGQPGQGAKPGGEPSSADKRDPAKADKSHAGSPPGEPGKGQVTGRPGGVEGDREPASPINEKFARQAGDLQLETFRKKVDQKVLDQVKMTESEYQQFLQAYAKLIQKQKAEATGADNRVRAVGKGGSAANSKATKVDGSANGPKVERGSRGQPPAEFRDQYREFTEQQSKEKKN